VLVELLEWLILVILSSNVCASLAESFKLFLNFLCRGLDIRLDSLKVLLVIHLCSGISDDLDVFGEEFVPVLQALVWISERRTV
jgi:hypothetical protein